MQSYVLTSAKEKNQQNKMNKWLNSILSAEKIGENDIKCKILSWIDQTGGFFTGSTAIFS